MPDPSQTMSWSDLLQYLTGGDPHSQKTLGGHTFGGQTFGGGTYGDPNAAAAIANQPSGIPNISPLIQGATDPKSSIPFSISPGEAAPSAPPSAGTTGRFPPQIPTAQPQAQAQSPTGAPDLFSAQAALGPLTPLLMAGAHPDATDHVSNILASMGISPTHLGFHSGTGATDDPGVSGTTIAPVTRTPGDAGAGATTSADRTTGDPGASPTSSMAIQDAGGGQAMPASTLRPQSAVEAGSPTGSTKDTVTTGQGGISGGDVRQDPGVQGPDPSKPPTDWAGSIAALGKALGSLKAPAERDPHFPTPPRVETSQHRFNPTDLLTLVQNLSTPAASTAPQSLGQLIGR